MIIGFLSKDLIFCGTFNAKLIKYKLTWFHDVRSIKNDIYNGFVNYCNEMLDSFMLRNYLCMYA